MSPRRLCVRAGNNFFSRPVTLTKFALPDWRAGMDAIMHQESPAHHRYPVWWTGDGVGLQGSVESMVNAGMTPPGFALRSLGSWELRLS